MNSKVEVLRNCDAIFVIGDVGRRLRIVLQIGYTTKIVAVLLKEQSVL